jgi:hypothetical protein
MRGHQLAPVEDLYRLDRDACLNLLTQQPEWHRIEVLLNLDMVIEVYPATLPRGELVLLGRQW